MSETPQPSPAAGWYSDPKMPGTQRFWDGSTWSDHVAPAAPQVQARGPQSGYSGLAVAGIFLAFVILLVGFIIGVVVAAKEDGSAGPMIIVLSVLAGVGWFLLLAGQSVSLV